MQPKVANHPKEDGAKVATIPFIRIFSQIWLSTRNRFTSLESSLYSFGYLNENKINESGNYFLLCFSPYFWLLKTFKSTSFSNLLIYNLSFCRNVGQVFF
jgi:GT2 family glycosyltransferase